MAGYESGEAFLLTKCAAASGFSSTNTARSDWKLMDKGASDHYAILRPGVFEMAANSMGGGAVLRYTTMVEVWQQYTDETTTQSNLYGHVYNLLLELVKWPRLGGIAEDVNITSGGEIQQMWREGGGPAWLMQELTVSWAELLDVTFSE